jgi:hypothetical protein
MNYKGHINIPTIALMMVVNIIRGLGTKVSTLLKQMAFLGVNKSNCGAGLKKWQVLSDGTASCGGRSCEISLVTHFFCYGSKYKGGFYV